MHRFLLFFLPILTLTSITSLRAQELERESESLAEPIVVPSDSGGFGVVNQLPENMRASIPFLRYYVEFAQHAGTSGIVDHETYLAAFEKAKSDMLRSSRAAYKGSANGAHTQAITSWTNIGLIGSASVPSGGIMTCITFDPNNPKTMYAGGSGGVWKSTDAGASWFQLTDNVLPNLTVASIAVDPSNSSTLYVGTGYCYNANVGYGGSGLWKSTNGGGTWYRLNVGSATSSWVKVLVDPVDPKIVFASGFDSPLGVYRSTDSGATWKPVLSKGTAWDLLSSSTSDNQHFLYAMCGNGGSSAGVYQSRDDGATWTLIATKDNGFYSTPTRIGRSAIASPQAAPNKLFTLMSDVAGDSAWVFKSIDTGHSWTSVSVPLNLFHDTGVAAVRGQGWYDLFLAVSPNSVSSDTVYIGGVMAYTMQGTSQWLEYSGYDGVAASNGPHVDHHSFAFDPLNSRIIYDGNDGGLWINRNAGSLDPGEWKLRDSQFVSNRVYHVAFDPLNINNTWDGFQDQGIWLEQKGKDPSKQSPAGDGMTAIVSGRDGTVYAEGIDGRVWRGYPGSVGDYFTPGDIIKDTPNEWDCPFRVSPINHGGISKWNIFCLGRQYFWTNVANQSNKWTTDKSISMGQGYDLNCTTGLALAPFNPGLVYISGNGNTLKMSEDFGKTWTSRAGVAPNALSGPLYSIEVTGADTNFILVSNRNATKHVMMSDDQGLTWKDVSGSGNTALPPTQIVSVALDSVDPLHTWYAATDFGMYFTKNAGSSWTYFGPGLFPCRDVQIAPNGKTMRVATFGRGIWEVSDVSTIIPWDAVHSPILSATKSNELTSLSWSVNEETPGAIYNVERSIDGSAFVSIGAQHGTGSRSYSFSDASTTPGSYLYQIHEIDPDGSQYYSNTVQLHYGSDQLISYQPYPNPFVNASGTKMTISFELPDRDYVSLHVYNTAGELVKTLGENTPLDGGPQSMQWDGTNETGQSVAAGAYFYSVTTEHSGTITGKLSVVKP